jgi:hypothetical protein
MSQTLCQFDEVIDALGGGSATARVCGQRPSAVCNWRVRDARFPCRYYWEIRCALAERGYVPSLALFNFYRGEATIKQLAA